MRPGTNLPLDYLILVFTCCPSRFLSVPGLKIPLTKSLVNLKIMAMLKASQKQAEFPKKVTQKTHPRVSSLIGSSEERAQLFEDLKCQVEESEAIDKKMQTGKKRGNYMKGEWRKAYANHK